MENKLELKKHPVCCGKKMHKEENVQQMVQEGETTQYVCLTCGGFINIIEGQLEEEELIDFKDMYTDEKIK